MATARKPKKKTPQTVIEPAPTKILAIDVGGTKVKILLSGETEPRKAPSGKKLTPARLGEIIKELAKGWRFGAVSIGLPALVGVNGPRSEPGNLGPGWVGFNYAAAFDCPVRLMNDAAMQALGSYEGGRMLFLGFGTGLGSAVIAEGVIVPMELGQIRAKNGETLGELLGRKGFQRNKDDWRKLIDEVVPMLSSAFAVDYTVIGGGNAKRVRKLPANTRRGHNLTAFRGGFRLWSVDDVPTHATDKDAVQVHRPLSEWRMI